MAAKKRSRKKTKGPQAKSALPTEGAPASATNRAGVAVAILLLAGLAAAVAVVGRRPPSAPPEGNALSDASKEPSDLETWRAAPLQRVAIAPDDYASGPEEAPVTIVEFSDFECPYCREASASLRSIRREYGDRVRLVFKNYPLDAACNDYVAEIHPAACQAAALARCAGIEGNFWRMHDSLFALRELRGPVFDELEAPYADCLDDEEILSPIRDDIEEGKDLGVTGTPTLFVNGRVAPSYLYDSLRSIIEHVLSSSPSDP